MINIDSFKIEAIKNYEVQILSSLYVQLWQESYWNILSSEALSKVNVKEKQQDIVKIFLSPQHLVNILKHQEKIIGFVIAGPLRPFYDIYNYNPKAYIGIKGEVWALYVAKPYQRMKLGQKLFNSAREWLIQRNQIPFMVWVFEKNKKAQAFYRKNKGSLIDKPAVLIDQLYDETAYKFV